MHLLLFLACKHPESSPPTLEDLSRTALKNFNEDSEAEDVNALLNWLVSNPTPESKGWAFTTIDAETVAEMPPDPDVDIDTVEAGGAGVLDTVDGEVMGYAEASVEADQSFADPTYNRWDRIFLSGEDCFLDGCDMDTDNDISKDGFGVTIDYKMFKDFRWVSTDLGDTMIARSWVPNSSFGEDGKNGILCGWTIEIWAPTDDGVLWFNGSWSRLKTILDDIATDDLMISELIKGTLKYYEGTEAHVNGTD